MPRETSADCSRVEHAARSTGAAIGIVLVVAGAISPSRLFTREPSDDAVARVNGKVIPAEALDLALGRLPGDRTQGGAPDEQRARILDRLIDEELLVQRGVEIGLVDSDRMVRRAITMAVIDWIVADAASPRPSERELWSFYESERALFAVPARVHARQIYFGFGKDRKAALGRAREAAAAIQGGVSFAEARARYGSPDEVPLPDTPLPLQVLRHHLGPSLTRRILAMTPGEVSEPVESPSGYHLLGLVSFEPERVRPFDEVRPEVEAECERRGRDEALRQALHRLRADASIVLSTRAPRSSGDR